MQPKDPQNRALHFITRRHFFEQCGVGLGKTALTALFAGNSLFGSAKKGPALEKLHLTAKAKNVIYLFYGRRPESVRVV